jgi:tetratricopeptide (TPR) repeat protein
VSLSRSLSLGLCLGAIFAYPVIAEQAAAELNDNAEIAFHLARVAARPDDTDALRRLADAYVRRAEVTGAAADYDRAWDSFDRAERLEPGDPRTIHGRAAALLSRHRFPHALALAQQGLVRYPEDIDLLRVAGDAALEIGDFDLAERHYTALHKRSRRVSEWARLAHLAELRGDLDLAAKQMASAIEAGVRPPAPHATLAWTRAVLGEIELKRGRRDEARRQYAVGLEISPNHALVLEHLAELERLEGNLATAAAAYRTILSQRWNAGIAVALAKVLDEQGRRDEAAKYRDQGFRFYERSVAEGNEGYLRQLATLDLAAGRFERAASLMARDLALRPNAEGRALLMEILRAAAAAGQPVSAFTR